MKDIKQENKTRVRVFISGNVHGVTFRTNTARRARALGLYGWVKNVLRGVEAVFEGGGEEIKQITDWMKKGPRGAVIKRCEITEELYQGEFNDFEIRYE